MSYPSLASIESLVREFERQTLPLQRWTHRAHLSVCTWYLITDPGAADQRFRAGIRSYLRAHGIATTAGYHETLTCFWISMVRNLLDVCEGPELAVLNTVVDGLADKDLVFYYYSPAQLWSVAARVRWVAPDRRALPDSDPVARLSAQAA